MLKHGFMVRGYRKDEVFFEVMRVNHNSRSQIWDIEKKEWSEVGVID